MKKLKVFWHTPVENIKRILYPQISQIVADKYRNLCMGV